MDAKHEAYASTLKINHFKPDKVPWRRLGQCMLLSGLTFVPWYPIPPEALEHITEGEPAVSGDDQTCGAPLKTSDGPIFHFHEMHDEGFYVTKGKVRFHVPGRPAVDVATGEMVTVPIRLPHKFSNPFDEEAVFINTATPGFFVRYFEHLETMIGEGKVLTPEVNAEALRRFATIPLPPEDTARLETKGWNSAVSKDSNKKHHVVGGEDTADPVADMGAGGIIRSGTNGTNGAKKLKTTNNICEVATVEVMDAY
ncbi:hypothetical protein B0H63DRAFT_528967 [Podospora didyma]|uniref:Cupin type-2 domain-containing protein n=1 Tax=Podospora didyma TaxID=330526 RepID=A0AAE0N2L3_9PEZI|nr:hypothetical protein B0H63DRAFT_528967 [Podospora didyma]